MFFAGQKRQTGREGEIRAQLFCYVFYAGKFTSNLMILERRTNLGLLDFRTSLP